MLMCVLFCVFVCLTMGFVWFFFVSLNHACVTEHLFAYLYACLCACVFDSVCLCVLVSDFLLLCVGFLSLFLLPYLCNWVVCLHVSISVFVFVCVPDSMCLCAIRLCFFLCFFVFLPPYACVTERHVFMTLCLSMCFCLSDCVFVCLTLCFCVSFCLSSTVLA